MGANYLSINDLTKEAVKNFKQQFKVEPTIACYAPGRVNLLGEHTDYNNGYVLPMALPLVTVIVGRPTDTETAKIHTNSKSVNGPHFIEFPVQKEKLRPETGEWANYVKGVIAFFPGKVTGFEAVIVTSVPIGGGLSSSASVEVATYTFLESLTNTPASSPIEKALICQKAEHEFAKMPCGIMDQFISVMGKEGCALLIDTKTNTSELIHMYDPNVVILITNSNVKHELANSEYPKRRNQCYAAAKLLNIESLREAPPTAIEDLKKLGAEPVIIQRARHVIGEIYRTKCGAEALKSNDYVAFGKLMVLSHNSLRDDYEVSCPELDQLVEYAIEIDGVYGSRMTGGGFGGCTVTLLKKDVVNKVIENIKQKYHGQPTFYICSPSEGAQTLKL